MEVCRDNGGDEEKGERGTRKRQDKTRRELVTEERKWLEATRLKGGSNRRRKNVCFGTTTQVGSRPFLLVVLPVSWLLRLKPFFLQGSCTFVHVKCLEPMCSVKERSHTSLEKETRCL